MLKYPSIFASCLALWFTSSLAVAENLIPNGDFESGIGNNGSFVPDESKNKDCKLEESTETAHSGKMSVKLSSNDFARYSMNVRSAPVILAGNRYKISAYIKGSQETQFKSGTPGVMIRLQVMSGKNPIATGETYYIGLNSALTLQQPQAGLNLAKLIAPVPANWTKIEAIIEVPKDLPGADALAAPEIFCWYAKGPVWIDDLSIEKVDSATPLTPLAQAPRKVPTIGPVTSDGEALSLLNLDYSGLDAVKIAAASGNMNTVKQAYLDFRRNKSTAKLWRDYPAPTPSNNTDEVAEEICRHLIRNHYGFNPRTADMGKDFNWKYNPIPKDSPSFTQEWTWCSVARMHFWGTLTTAYSNTGNEKYAREWIDQLQDFAAKNPVGERLKPGDATLWRTLDSAIRMYSLSSSYYRCINSPSFTPEAQWVLLRLINDHAQLLREGLSPDRTGNWVTTECAALYLIGTMFPEFKDASEWRRIAIDRLLHEANFAVPPDGFEAELTPNYHFVTLNGYISPVELARRNNVTLPPEFESKMLAMYRAGVLIMDQSGKMPPVNDSVIIDAVERAKQGVRILGNDPLLLWAATGGKEGQQPPTSVELPYAGFYAMRSGWQINDTFLFFRGGPAGIGHQHEDMLSIILRAGNRTLLFDPGTYNYDHSDWRRYAINTPSHNTIIVDGKWQNRGPNKPPVEETVKNPWVTTPLFDYVSSTYDGGYQLNQYNQNRQYGPQDWVGDVDRSVVHTRHVLFIKPKVVLVLDSLAGMGSHTFDAHFHLDSPGAKQNSSTGVITSQNADGMQLSLYPLDQTHLSTDIVIGQKDPLLGWFTGENERYTRPIPTVRFRKKQNAPATFATLLIPHESTPPRIAASPIEISEPSLWAQNISIDGPDNQNLQIFLSRDQKASDFQIEDSLLGSYTANASGVLLRQKGDRKQTSLGLWGVTQWNSNKLQFSSSSPASLLIVPQQDNLYIYNGDKHDISIALSLPWQMHITLSAGKWGMINSKGMHESAGPSQ